MAGRKAPKSRRNGKHKYNRPQFESPESIVHTSWQSSAATAWRHDLAVHEPAVDNATGGGTEYATFHCTPSFGSGIDEKKMLPDRFVRFSSCSTWHTGLQLRPRLRRNSGTHLKNSQGMANWSAHLSVVSLSSIKLRFYTEAASSIKELLCSTCSHPYTYFVLCDRRSHDC
jgi:hypothetical protein